MLKSAKNAPSRPITPPNGSQCLQQQNAGNSYYCAYSSQSTVTPKRQTYNCLLGKSIMHILPSSQKISADQCDIMENSAQMIQTNQLFYRRQGVGIGGMSGGTFCTKQRIRVIPQNNLVLSFKKPQEGQAGQKIHVKGSLFLAGGWAEEPRRREISIDKHKSGFSKYLNELNA